MATRSSTRRTKNSKTNWVLVPNYRRAARSSPAGQPRTGSPASRIQAVGGHGCSPPRQIRRQDTGSTASRGGLRRPGRTTAGAACARHPSTAKSRGRRPGFRTPEKRRRSRPPCSPRRGNAAATCEHTTPPPWPGSADPAPAHPTDVAPTSRPPPTQAEEPSTTFGSGAGRHRRGYAQAPVPMAPAARSDRGAARATTTAADAADETRGRRPGVQAPLPAMRRPGRRDAATGDPRARGRRARRRRLPPGPFDPAELRLTAAGRRRSKEARGERRRFARVAPLGATRTQEPFKAELNHPKNNTYVLTYTQI